MSFTENLYLKQQLKKLQEENLKLKQILSEADEGTPAAHGMMARPAVDRVMGNRTPLHQMTPEEAFQHGVDHAMLQGISTPPHFFNNPHFAAGFNSAFKQK